jgi:hypothetical protein
MQWRQVWAMGRAAKSMAIFDERARQHIEIYRSLAGRGAASARAEHTATGGGACERRTTERRNLDSSTFDTGRLVWLASDGKTLPSDEEVAAWLDEPRKRKYLFQRLVLLSHVLNARHLVFASCLTDSPVGGDTSTRMASPRRSWRQGAMHFDNRNGTRGFAGASLPASTIV